MGTTTVATDRLSVLESVIERGLDTFLEVGAALAEIRDHKLFRATHDSFLQYLKERWDLSQSSAYYLISTSQVATAIKESGQQLPAGTPAMAMDALVPLLNQDGGQAVAHAWGEVMDGRASDAGPPTGTEVRASLRAAGSVTTAEPKPRPISLAPVGSRLEAAAKHLAEVDGELDLPLAPSNRARAQEWAKTARAIAARLEELADPSETSQALQRAQERLPEGVPCIRHGVERDEFGVCVACRRPDLTDWARRRGKN